MSRYVFPEWTEKFKRWLGILLLGAPVYLVTLIAYGVSPEAIRLGYEPVQPVPYSHALHVGQLGIDCRYCHNTVEVSGHAAVPPAATCMNCHTGIFPESPKLLPVREAYSNNQPLHWTKVYDLPDYVFFNHSAHVTRGVGCETCHGRIDQMAVVYQATPLTMDWCVSCHRNPTPILRDPAQATTMGYTPAPGEGARIRKENNINPPTDCSTCHR